MLIGIEADRSAEVRGTCGGAILGSSVEDIAAMFEVPTASVAHLPESGPFAIAAVWDSWKSPDGSSLETCAVVTTAACGPVARLHDRIPVALDAEARDRRSASAE